MDKKAVLLLISLFLSACSIHDTVVVGAIDEEIEIEKVKLYYDELPQCDFSVVAHMRVPGDYYSHFRIISIFKQKAAQMGATGVQITHLKKIGSAQYMGSARAIRCEST